MQTSARHRVGAAFGAAYVLLIIVGNSMNTAGTDQSSHPSGQSVLRDIAHQHASAGATVGFVLELLGFVSFLGFLGFVADLARRYAGSWRLPLGTAFASGVVLLTVKLASGGPVMVLDLDRHTLSPELAQVLNDLNGAAFVISWLPFAVMVWGLAAGLRGAGLVGRPTAWTGMLLGVAGVALGVVGVRDPLGASPVAFLLGLVWLLVVSVRLVVRPTAPAEVSASAEQRELVSA